MPILAQRGLCPGDALGRQFPIRVQPKRPAHHDNQAVFGLSGQFFVGLDERQVLRTTKPHFRLLDPP